MLVRQDTRSDDLLRYATGEVRPRRDDRAVAKRARTVYDQARLTGMKADAALALGARILDGVTALDLKRRSLQDGDPLLDACLFRVQVATTNCALKLQAELVASWRP